MSMMEMKVSISMINFIEIQNMLKSHRTMSSLELMNQETGGMDNDSA